MGDFLLLILVKRRISVSLGEDLIEMIDYIIKKKYGGLPRLRSSIIELHLRGPIIDEFKKIREGETRQKARVII